MTPYGNFSWWVLLLFNIPITLAVSGLFVYTCMNIYNNKSTLEAMRPDSQSRKPCLPVKNSAFTKPNPYDMLWINNIRDVMGPHLILWPIPFYAPEMKGQGLYFPEIPAFKPNEQGVFSRDNNGVLKRDKKIMYDAKG